MKTTYLLDTNTVSYVLKRRPPAVLERIEQVQKHSDVAISSVTEAELLYGYLRAGVGPERFQALNLFLMRVTVLSWGRSEARAYAELRTKQERMGRPLGHLDTLIAAHAIATHSILVTHDAALKQVHIPAGIDDWAAGL